MNVEDPDNLPDRWEIETFGTLEYGKHGDQDNDGLDNRDEHKYGSNPNNPDTDADGLDDREEVKIHKTDPNSSDSDGDGYSDGFEIAHGSNPNEYGSSPGVTTEANWDTDGGGIPDIQEIAYGTNPAVDYEEDDRVPDELIGFKLSTFALGYHDGWKFRVNVGPYSYEVRSGEHIYPQFAIAKGLPPLQVTANLVGMPTDKDNRKDGALLNVKILETSNTLDDFIKTQVMVHDPRQLLDKTHQVSPDGHCILFGSGGMGVTIWSPRFELTGPAFVDPTLPGAEIEYDLQAIPPVDGATLTGGARFNWERVIPQVGSGDTVTWTMPASSGWNRFFAAPEWQRLRNEWDDLTFAPGLEARPTVPGVRIMGCLLGNEQYPFNYDRWVEVSCLAISDLSAVGSTNAAGTPSPWVLRTHGPWMKYRVEAIGLQESEGATMLCGQESLQLTWTNSGDLAMTWPEEQDGIWRSQEFQFAGSATPQGGWPAPHADKLITLTPGLVRFTLARGSGGIPTAGGTQAPGGWSGFWDFFATGYMSPADADDFIANITHETSTFLEASNWAPTSYNDGAFGKEVHRRVTEEMKALSGWVMDLYIDKATRKILFIAPTEAELQAAGIDSSTYNQVDAVKLNQGASLNKGDTWDAAKVQDLYDIKATISGRKPKKDQHDALKSLVGPGRDYKVVYTKRVYHMPSGSYMGTSKNHHFLETRYLKRTVS